MRVRGIVLSPAALSPSLMTLTSSSTTSSARGGSFSTSSVKSMHFTPPHEDKASDTVYRRAKQNMFLSRDNLMRAYASDMEFSDVINTRPSLGLQYLKKITAMTSFRKADSLTQDQILKVVTSLFIVDNLSPSAVSNLSRALPSVDNHKVIDMWNRLRDYTVDHIDDFYVKQILTLLQG
jgi:hypothetical protein